MILPIIFIAYSYDLLSTPSLGSIFLFRPDQKFRTPPLAAKAQSYSSKTEQVVYYIIIPKKPQEMPHFIICCFKQLPDSKQTIGRIR